MYVPSLAINAATGGQVDLNTMTIVVGVLVTSYTMLGGIEAVIWNDVIQFCIMFGGLAATVGIVWWSVPGGFSEIWSSAAAAGKLDIWMPLSDPGAAGVVGQISSFFHQPMNMIALLVALVVGRMAQYTSDQVMVQRLQSTRSLREARQAFIVNAAGDALWMIGLSFVGFALFAYFQQHPLPVEMQTDKLVPYFMSLGAYDFYWLGLEKPQAEISDRPTLAAGTTWTTLLEPRQRPQLVRALLQYAQNRRWYRGKARTRKNAQIAHVIQLGDPRFAIALVAIEYDNGKPETYVMPLAFAEDSEPGERQLVIASVTLTIPGRGQVTGVLYDALCSDAFDNALLAAMREEHRGQLSGHALEGLRAVPADANLGHGCLSLPFGWLHRCGVDGDAILPGRAGWQQ